MNSKEFQLPDVPKDGWSDRNSWDDNVDCLMEENAAISRPCFDHKILETKLKIAESKEFNVTAGDHPLAQVDEMFRGNLPTVLLKVKGRDPRLETIETFDELKSNCERTPNNESMHTLPDTLTAAPVDVLAHYVTFGEYISNLYVNNELADTSIEVEGCNFMAHRSVLCCHSNYLENIFLRKRPDSVPVEVKLVGVSADAFSNFLQFIYTGHLQIQTSYVLDMFVIAEKLGIKALKNILAAEKNRYSLQQVLQLLLQYGPSCSNQLYSNLLARVTREFDAASRLADFLNMDVNLLCFFLQSDDLQVASEFDLFQIALRWIVHGGQDRVQYACRIMSLIRYPHMSRLEMMRCAEETDLFIGNSDLRLQLIIAVWYATALKLQRSDPLDVKIPPARRGYKTRYLPVTTCAASCFPPPPPPLLTCTTLDMNQSSLPNKPGSSHSPRHAKPVLLPQDDHVVKQKVVIAQQKEKSPKSPRFAKPVLVPQDTERAHDNYTPATPKPTVNSPTRFAKPVLVPQKDIEHPPENLNLTHIAARPPVKFAKPVMMPFQPREHAAYERPLPKRFSKPIIWPPQKGLGENSYEEDYVTPTTPVSAQRAFWEGKPPKQAFPQPSPIRHAKPVLVPTPSPTDASPVFVFPSTYDEDSMPPPLPLPFDEEDQDNGAPEEFGTPSTSRQADHLVDPMSQFASKISSTNTASYCQHPSEHHPQPSPGRFAKPLMLPSSVNQDHQTTNTLCMTPGSQIPDGPTWKSRQRPTAIEIFIIGGFCDDIHSQKDKDIDTTSNRWTRYCSLPAPRKNFAVAMVARKVYLIGGCDPTKGNVATNTLYQMDFDSKIWRKMTPMWECRESHCACAVDRIIYVMGGLDGDHRPLSSVECYNVHTDSWFTVTSMPEPIFAAAATTLKGRCYIAGGLTRLGADNTLKALDAMYCFDPQTNGWKKHCSLRTPVCHSSLVNVEGCLYLCGGAILAYLDSHEVVLRSIATVDKYNPDLRSWEPMTEMMVPRHSAAVAVAGSRLFIIGGKNSTTERYLRSTECLDTQSVSWATESVDLPFPARSISCVVCPMYGNTS